MPCHQCVCPHLTHFTTGMPRCGLGDGATPLQVPRHCQQLVSPHHTPYALTYIQALRVPSPAHPQPCAPPACAPWPHVPQLPMAHTGTCATSTPWNIMLQTHMSRGATTHPIPPLTPHPRPPMSHHATSLPHHHAFRHQHWHQYPCATLKSTLCRPFPL